MEAEEMLDEIGIDYKSEGGEIEAKGFLRISDKEEPFVAEIFAFVEDEEKLNIGVVGGGTFMSLMLENAYELWEQGDLEVVERGYDGSFVPVDE